MASVLVVGGTGMLGSTLVPALLSGGHEVRVLSRRAAPQVPDGAEAVRGDVRTGEGLDPALEGTDTVVQAVAGRRKLRETELAGMRSLLERVGTRHLVYVSIVGVDQGRFSYYRAKLEVERMLEGSAARWTIQRATQFHELVDRIFATGWCVRTPDLRFQPVAGAEVSTRLAELVDAGPSGRAPDFGGPEVLFVEELERTYREVTGRRVRLVPLPRLGFVADLDAGVHLAADRRSGSVTWRQWLEARRAGDR